VVGLLSHHFPLAGQDNLPASEANHAGSNLQVGWGEPTPRTLQVEGKVTSVEGEPLAGATVWVASFASPTQHLATTQADSNGDYVLEVPLPLQTGENCIVVGASHPEYAEAGELRGLDGSVHASKTTLILPRLEDRLEAPDLELIGAWLSPRLARTHDCRGQNGSSSCRTLEEALVRVRKQAPDWAGMEQLLERARQSNLPQLRLLAAFELMRMGSWQGAGSMLPLNSAAGRLSEEQLLLRGIYLSFLHKSEESQRDLERARALDPRSALIELELGRAAVEMEDWPTAAARLDRPLRQRNLASQAHYLRARSLIAFGDSGGASLEAGMLEKDLKRKRASPDAQSLLDDLERRMHQPALQSLESVMNQPVGELQQAASELKDLNPSGPPPPGGLEEFLRAVGVGVEATLRNLSNTVASEVIRQTQLDRKGKARNARSMECNYVFVHNTSNGKLQVDEYRGNKEGHPMSPGRTEGGFMVTSGFVSSLMVFHPEFQAHTAYRFLGTQSLSGEPTYVIGFAQKPDSPSPLGRFVVSLGNITNLYLQGMAWISPDHQVLRLRTDLVHPIEKISLNRETSEIEYRPYHFQSTPATFLLPNRVTVNVDWNRKRLRNEHIFSNFQLFNVEVQEDSANGAPALDARQTFRINPNNDNLHVNRGLTLDNQGHLDAAMGEYREALRLNAKNDLAHYNLGMALEDKGDLEGAIGEYREALSLDPENADAHLNLGSALYRIGNLDAAIAEYRAGLRLNPDNNSAHYNLGIALGANGALDGAVKETRAALRLDPSNPQLHYSLAYWLEKTGARDKALEEYRLAYTLRPDNSVFKRAYERLARKPKSRRASESNGQKPGNGV